MTTAAARRMRLALLRLAWNAPCLHGCARWVSAGRPVLIGKAECDTHGFSVEINGEPR